MPQCFLGPLLPDSMTREPLSHRLLEPLALALAERLAALEDFELQELALDSVYTLWRQWSRRAAKGDEGASWSRKANRLMASLNPKLRACALETFQRTRTNKQDFSEVWAAERTHQASSFSTTPFTGRRGVVALQKQSRVCPSLLNGEHGCRSSSHS